MVGRVAPLAVYLVSDDGDAESRLATFIAGATPVAPVATPTDFVTLTNPVGSGKILRIHAFRMLVQSTAGSLQTFLIIRRTAANTGGTSTNPASQKKNSASANAVGVITQYSANPASLGTGATLCTLQVVTAVLTAAPAIFSVAGLISLASQSVSTNEALILNPGETLAANFNGAAVPAGGVFGWDMEWSEAPV